ncbi:MAG: DMT family transporter [Chitinophagales bacterium]
MKNIWAHIALLGANLLYGANYTVAKFVMPEYLEPFGFIFMRVVGAVLFFWTAHFLFLKEKVAKKDMIRLFFCGMFGVALNQLMFFKGLSLTQPLNASLIMITTPILVMLISVFAAKEKMTWYKAVGMLLGAGGAFWVIGGDDFNFSSSTALGDFFIFINATSYAIYLILVKPLMKKYKPLTVVKWVFFFGFIPVLFLGMPDFLSADFSVFPPDIWWSVVFVVFGVTCGAYLFNAYAISKVNPSVVGIYIYLQPILATLVALFFGMDKLTMHKIMAAVIIFAGVYLVSFFNPSIFKKKAI